VSGQEQDISNPIAANLIAEMARTGETIASLAAALGVGERQITRWRGGQEPRWSFVRQMEQHFGREAGWFYTVHVSTEQAA
jgi:hypothetical protein